ncbi:hypothetical protein BY458DRAFT_524269 [Sporodiniella umbellata]|nr:hypothetical protein BY458DRAFT_524269 [Sporodiniella umbellata]
MAWLSRPTKKLSRVAVFAGLLFLFFLWYLPLTTQRVEIKQSDDSHSHYTQASVTIAVTSATQLISFYPLLCRFRQYPVNVVLLGQDLQVERTQEVLAQTNCTHLNQVRLQRKEQWADVLKTTEILIRIDEAHPILDKVRPSLETIRLPSKEIVHSLWIPDLSVQALKSWNKVDIKLVIITDRRPHSLSRLLQSASAAYYLGDRADVMIHMEQSSDRATRMLVNSFVWRQGKKFLKHRIKKGGLMPAIVESWYPSSNDEYAVLLEDDIEVSPLFYVWSKYAILKYRYGASKAAYQQMYGVSLYSPRNLELVPEGRVKFDPNLVLKATHPPGTPYASQIPCSWGAVYFPEHWREFHAYLVRRLEDLQLPKNSQVRVIRVPGSRSDKWKKSWKKYFIELVYLRAYVMLYPNFDRFEAFSTNHVEFGTHVQSEKRQAIVGTFTVPLMVRDTLLAQLPEHRLPYYEDLPLLDLWGRPVDYPTLDARAQAFHTHVSTCPRQLGAFDPRDVFCPVDGPPDLPQVFPMSPKKPKPPVLERQAVQPIEYNYLTKYTQQQEEAQHQSLGPKPIDVAQLPPLEDKPKGKDDEAIDLENDLDTLHRIYYKLYPDHLDFLNDEKLAMEEEEETDLEEDDLEDDFLQPVEE